MAVETLNLSQRGSVDAVVRHLEAFVRADVGKHEAACQKVNYLAFAALSVSVLALGSAAYAFTASVVLPASIVGVAFIVGVVAYKKNLTARWFPEFIPGVFPSVYRDLSAAECAAIASRLREQTPQWLGEMSEAHREVYEVGFPSLINDCANLADRKEAEERQRAEQERKVAEEKREQATVSLPHQIWEQCEAFLTLGGVALTNFGVYGSLLWDAIKPFQTILSRELERRVSWEDKKTARQFQLMIQRLESVIPVLRVVEVGGKDLYKLARGVTDGSHRLLSLICEVECGSLPQIDVESCTSGAATHIPAPVTQNDLARAQLRTEQFMNELSNNELSAEERGLVERLRAFMNEHPAHSIKRDNLKAFGEALQPLLKQLGEAAEARPQGSKVIEDVKAIVFCCKQLYSLHYTHLSFSYRHGPGESYEAPWL